MHVLVTCKNEEDQYILNSFSFFEPYLDVYQSLHYFFVDIHNNSILLWLSLPFHSGFTEED